MTTGTRSDRDLPAILEELYLGRTPDYRDQVLAAVAETRQRPSWTFAGRWLPMADFTNRAVLAPRMPWQLVGTVLLIVALLIVIVAVTIGSRQSKVPAPFGPARNGVIAYAAFGDIYTAGPVTGAATPVVTGPALDSGPIFSRDGTRIAFLRLSDSGQAYDLMVAGADGSGVRAVAGSPIQGVDPVSPFDIEWAADGQSLIVYAEPRILRIDAVGTSSPQVISGDAVPTGRLGPSGLIPYQPRSISEDALWTTGLTGATPTQLLRRTAATSSGGDLSNVRFSPDGSMLAYQSNLLPGEPNQLRIFVARADGTGARRLTDVTGPGIETDLTWSPDSTRIAFNRWVPVNPSAPDGDWESEAIGIAAVAGAGGGSPVVATGPSLGSQGAIFEWSPDGTELMALPARPAQAAMLVKPTVIDVATGEARMLDLAINSMTSWQRLAP